MNFYIRHCEFVNLNFCYPNNFVLCILVQCVNLCPVIHKRLRVAQLHWMMDSGSKRSEGWYSYYRSWRHPGHSWCHHRVVPKPSRYGFRYLEYRNSAYMKQLLIHFTQWSPPRVFHCAVYRAWCGKWECDVLVTSLLIETNTSLLTSSIVYTSILHTTPTSVTLDSYDICHTGAPWLG